MSNHRHWMRRPIGGAVLLACCLATYLPGLFTLPPIDRDEARFADATRGMLVADTWRAFAVPRFADEPRINKPPLTYWIQAAFVGGLRAASLPAGGIRPSEIGPAPAETSLMPGLPLGGIWAYRLASVAGTLLAVFVTWRLGLRMFAPPAAWTGALLLGVCALVEVDVRQARADELLLGFTVVAQLGMWNVWRAAPTGRGGTGRWAVVFWVAMILGVLTKGPVTPAVALLTAVALSVPSRNWRWVIRLRPFVGLTFVVLASGAWFGLIASDVGTRRAGLSVLQETVGRLYGAREGHGGFPGYHLLLLPLLFWPGSLLLVPALANAFIRGLRARRTENGKTRAERRLRWWPAPGRRAEFFCIAWLVPSWLLFELAGTKLPHYPLPLYPALALLAGRGLYSGMRGWRLVYQRTAGRAALVGWMVLSEVVVVGAPIALAVIARLRINIPLLASVVVAAVIGQVLLVRCFQLLHRRRPVRSLPFAILASTVLCLSLFQLVLPNLRDLWVTARVAERIHELDPTGRMTVVDPTLLTDSLVFLTRGRVYRPRNDDPQPPDIRMIAGRTIELIDDGKSNGVHPGDAIAGFDYTTGRWVTVSLRIDEGSAERGRPRN